VFENILQYEEEKYPVEELKYAAAYLLLNQLLFYHVLARKRGMEFDEIDSDMIKKPKDLNDHFRKVLNVNYKTVFSYDIASLIPTEFIDQVRTLVNVIEGLSPEKVGGDLLGTIFHDLIPFETRKVVAAFYTNVLAAELLASLSIDRHTAKIADFALGSGGLLVAAYRRKKGLLDSHFTQEDHRRFVEEELLGVDIMPFAANVAACHLALQSPEYFTNRVQVAVYDSTILKPKSKIPTVAAASRSYLTYFIYPEYRAKGVVTLGKEVAEEIELGKYDVVIMNPPFTRQERITDEYKQSLYSRFADEYKDYLHGQLGYYGYFILLADRFIKKDGRIALVLPATVLRVQSCEGIRKLLSEKYHIEHIITTLYRSAFSESTRFREILLVARKIDAFSKGTKTRITILKVLPSTIVEVNDLTNLLNQAQGAFEDNRVIIKDVEYSSMRDKIDNWFRFIALMNHSLFDKFSELMSMIEICPLINLSKIVRGYELRSGVVQPLIILSNPARAIKSSDIWILHSVSRYNLIFKHRHMTSIQIKLLNKFVRRTIRRASGLERIDVTGDLDYIIVQPQSHLIERLRDASGTKITAELIHAVNRDLGSRLGNLFVVADMDLSASGTSAVAFYSSHKVAPTKTFWSMSLQDDDAKILCLYLNSVFNLIQILMERVETRGAFIRIREYFLENFIVPDPTKLPISTKRMLVETFEKIKKIQLPSIIEQLSTSNNTRRTIDMAWLKAFEYKGDMDYLLDGLYKSLSNEIQVLRGIMAEGKGLEED
ncbi:MAG: SAM-dependent DNA methyltransferase, partial [archaeon]|nr:SAM-dependent DNA methyltransferase [archaeon]